MSDAILVSVITAGLSLIGTVITVLTANRQTIATLDKKSETSDIEIKGKIDVIQQEIKTLSERVEKHNSVIDRTYALEKKAAVTEEQLKTAAHRIDELEKPANKKSTP